MNFLSYEEKTELRKMLDFYLQKGYIRPSEAEFSSPIVLVRKKTGDLRLCVDYRNLNKITVKDCNPIPMIDDLMDRLSGKKFFTILNLRNGFFYVFVEPDSVKYTSFGSNLIYENAFWFEKYSFGVSKVCKQGFI